MVGLLLASISTVAEPLTAAAGTIPDYSTTLTGGWVGTRSAMRSARCPGLRVELSL